MSPRTHWALRAVALTVITVLSTCCTRGRTLDPATATEPSIVIVYPRARCVAEGDAGARLYVDMQGDEVER